MELDRLERQVADRQLDEADVDLASLDRVHDRLVLELLQHHVDPRPGFGEPPHDLRQQPGPRGLERPDAERPRLACPEGVQVGLRGLQARDDRLRVPEEEPAGLRERHGPRAARALDEPLADDALERGDLLADRRLRVAEANRRPAERAFVRECLEGGEVPHLDAATRLLGSMIDINRIFICADSPCSGTIEAWQ